MRLLNEEQLEQLLQKPTLSEKDAVAIVQYLKPVLARKAHFFLYRLGYDLTLRGTPDEKASLREDLVAEGFKAALRIIGGRKWNVEKGRFLPYMRKVHTNAMLRYLLTHNYIKLSRKAQDHWKPIWAQFDTLWTAFGHEPTAEDVALALQIEGLTKHHVAEVLNVHRRVIASEREDEEGNPVFIPDYQTGRQDPEGYEHRLTSFAEQLYAGLKRCLGDEVICDKWFIVRLLRIDNPAERSVWPELVNDLRDEHAEIGQAVGEDARSPWQAICTEYGLQQCLPPAWKTIYDLFRWGTSGTGYISPLFVYVDDQATHAEKQDALNRSCAAMRQWHRRMFKAVQACRQQIVA